MLYLRYLNGLGGTRTRNLDRYERCVLPIELQDLKNLTTTKNVLDGNRTRVLALKKQCPTTRRREHIYCKL